MVSMQVQDLPKGTRTRTADKTASVLHISTPSHYAFSSKYSLCARSHFALRSLVVNMSPTCLFPTSSAGVTFALMSASVEKYVSILSFCNVCKLCIPHNQTAWSRCNNDGGGSAN